MAFRIRDMHYTPGETQGAHAHEELQISIILRGELHEDVNGVAYRGAVGDVVLKPAGLRHANEFEATRIVCLDADPALIEAVPRGYTWRRDAAITGAAMRVAIAFLRNHDAGDDVADLLGALAPIADAPLANKAARALEEQFESTVSIDDLASTLGVHRVYLARVFRARWRCSPREYLQRTRVRAAARALSGSARPLADIALDAGFSDQAHMSRLFARQTGMTPAAFRRLARG